MKFTPRRNRSVKQRFQEKVGPPLPNGCCEWLGAICKKTGYGKLGVKGKAIGAHRVSWGLYRGHVPKGKQVLHICDNRRCVNPEHLFVGTAEDNVKDMDCKGRRRSKACKGEQHHRAKLTIQSVRIIRIAYDRAPRYPSGRLQYGVVAELSNKFGVSRSVITAVGQRQTWRHVK